MNLVEFEFYHIGSKIPVFLHVHLFSWSIYTLIFLCWIVIGRLVHLFCSQRNGSICQWFHMCSDCRKPVNSGRSVWMLLQDKVTRLQNLCNKDDWMCCSKMQVVFNKYTVLPQMSSCRGIFYNQCVQVFDISCLHQHRASWKQVPVHGVLSLIYRTHHSIIFLFLTYVQHHSSVFFKQVCLLTLALEKPRWGFHVSIISGHFQWCELGSGFITFAAHWFGLGSLTGWSGWLESGGVKVRVS